MVTLIILNKGRGLGKIRAMTQASIIPMGGKNMNFWQNPAKENERLMSPAELCGVTVG